MLPTTIMTINGGGSDCDVNELSFGARTFTRMMRTRVMRTGSSLKTLRQERMS